MSSARSTAREKKKDFPECSDLLLQKGNAKRVRLGCQSETSLQDLPTELLEDILIRAVVMEVKSMAKCVWKEKADLVMRRLQTVCSQWSNILTTNYFRNKVHGILEGTAQKPIRLEQLERLERHGPMVYANGATTMKDEIFVLWRNVAGLFAINVYNRSDMTSPTVTIPLPDISPLSLVASSVSNCLYLLTREQRLRGSVVRIGRSLNHQFNVSSVIGEQSLPSPVLSVTATGDIILSRQRDDDRVLIRIYSVTGSLQHELRLSTEISTINQIIAKVNGNLVLDSFDKGQPKRRLTEIDPQGTILRRYLPSIGFGALVCKADRCGRMLVVDGTPKRLVLLDSEFNTLELTGGMPDNSYRIFPNVVLFNGEREEMISISGRGPAIIYRLSDA